MLKRLLLLLTAVQAELAPVSSPTTKSPTPGWVTNTTTTPWPVIDRSPADHTILLAIIVAGAVFLSIVIFWCCTAQRLGYSWVDRKEI